MLYELMGLVHARIAHALRSERGQGTVEYVGLILLVAVMLAGIVAATRSRRFGDDGIAQTIINQIRRALGSITR